MADVEKIIKDLGADLGGSNEDQGKMAQLFKGLAFSDDPAANKYMNALNKWTTEYSKKMNEKGSKTAKCPDCGGKYLVNTGYCVSCKKKVAEPKSESVVIKSEFQIPGTDIMLEAGDSIRILKESHFRKIEEDIVETLFEAIIDEGGQYAAEEISDVLSMFTEMYVQNQGFDRSLLDFYNSLLGFVDEDAKQVARRV